MREILMLYSSKKNVKHICQNAIEKTKVKMLIWIWLIDWFSCNVNPSRVIFHQEVRELCSLYVDIYIFYVIATQEFLFYFSTQSCRMHIISKQIYLTQRWDPNGYYHSRSELSHGRHSQHILSPTERMGESE